MINTHFFDIQPIPGWEWEIDGTRAELFNDDLECFIQLTSSGIDGSEEDEELLDTVVNMMVTQMESVASQEGFKHGELKEGRIKDYKTKYIMAKAEEDGFIILQHCLIGKTKVLHALFQGVASSKEQIDSFHKMLATTVFHDVSQPEQKKVYLRKHWWQLWRPSI